MNEAKLLEWVQHRIEGGPRPFVLGVSGAQGSGKSTLCAKLARAMSSQTGLSILTLSLDDLYLTRAERQRLGKRVHPLCAVRGLPGTHDTALGHQLFDQLAEAQEDTVTHIPRFNKATDDRVPPQDFDAFIGRPDVIFFEGWCVGATPGHAWQGPINDREARDDPDGVWTRWTEAMLKKHYLSLWNRIDALVMIRVPSFEFVAEGRWRQEQKLLKRLQTQGRTYAASHVMNQEQVKEYVALFERKTRQLLEELPIHADAVVPAWRPSDSVAHTP